MTAADLKTGESAVITAVLTGGGLGLRLRELGLTRGTKITLRRKLPLGGPYELTLRGFELTLRKTEAAGIRVRRI